METDACSKSTILGLFLTCIICVNRLMEIIPYSWQRFQEITQSREFKAWFGNSKVVDETGLPLLVYRGERNPWIEMPTGRYDKMIQGMKQSGMNPDSPHYKFEVEHTERLGDVAWFTDNEGVAYGYADDSGHVMECFLSLQNPLDLRVSAIGADAALKIINQIYGSEDTFGDTNLYRNHAFQMADKVVFDNSRIIDWARRQGYDGLIHDDHCIYRKSCHHSYVAFHPQQIKSWSNRGTFRKAVANIYENIITEAVVDYDTTEEQVAAAQRICDIVKRKSSRMPIRIELQPDMRDSGFGVKFCHGIMVTDLYADEPGNGAGTKLMNYLFKLADEAGLNVGLNAEGPRSHRFYTKLGMVKDSSGWHHLVKHAELGPEYDYLFQESLTESTDGQTYYHVTFNAKLPKIMQDGIQPGKPRNWEKALDGSKYGELGHIFLFTTPESAARWAFKMHWEFKKDVSVLVINGIEHTDDDPSEEQYLMVNGRGTWKRLKGHVAPENIVRVVPWKQEMAKPLVKGGPIDF